MTDLVGQTIGQYQIVERLGRGGMADVYKAYHSGLAVHRALKVIRPEFVTETGFKERFQREAQAVAGLRHPNIVQMHDFGIQDNLYYMVMEFIEGRDLKGFLQERGQLRPFADILPIIEQVASALNYAHRRGVVHRDIKPGNIMLTPDGQAILTDFGIAKMVAGQESVTQTGAGIGTPAYMAPEQARGLPDVGPTADIYSLGIVLYEMLTGRVPYSADTPLAVMLKVVNDSMPPPRDFSPDIPDVVQGVVLKATAKNPAQRYPSAEAFADGLERSLSGQPVATPAQAVSPDATVKAQLPQTPATSDQRKAPWLAGMGGIVLLCVAALAAAGVAGYFWSRPAPALAAWQFVVDASAGMEETIDGQSKMEIARAALSEELDILPENVDAGLRIFGGGLSQAAACEDTTLLVEPAGGRRADLANALIEVNPSGDAPLTEAIVRAIGDFDPAQDIKKTLIIITAGLDTCEADAIGQLETLSRRLGIEFDLQLIGLGVEDEAEQAELRNIAEAAGGDYHNAQSKGDIIQVVEREVALLLGTPVAAATVAPSPAATAAIAAVPTASPTPPPPEALSLAGVNVTETQGASRNGRIMFDGEGTLHMVWVDTTPRVLAGEPGVDLLHRSMSADGTWSEVTTVTEQFKSMISSQVSLSRRPTGEVCAFWAAAGPEENAQKLYSQCWLGSAAVSKANLVQDAWRDADPAFTPDGVAQTTDIIGAGTLRFGEVELSDGFALASRPTFTIDAAGNYHSVWVRHGEPFSIEHRFSSDGGATWSEAERLSTPDAQSASAPQLAADRQGNVHLVWTEPGGLMLYSRWTAGEGWSEAVEISQDAQGSAFYRLRVDEAGLAHVVFHWIDINYVAQQPDGSWSAPLQLTQQEIGDPEVAGPDVAIDVEGNPHFIWKVSTDEEDIFYTVLE